LLTSLGASPLDSCKVMLRLEYYLVAVFTFTATKSIPNF
jgi:hypothetical protein